MDPYALLVIVCLLVGSTGVGLTVFLGYKWGKFAALQALAQDSPKWKAYVLALLPPAAFAVTLLFDGNLEPFAAETFWALATPAAIGACARINYGSHSTF